MAASTEVTEYNRDYPGTRVSRRDALKTVLSSAIALSLILLASLGQRGDGDDRAQRSEGPGEPRRFAIAAAIGCFCVPSGSSFLSGC